MKRIYIFLLLFCLFGCVPEKSNNTNIAITEDEWKRTIPPRTIAIPTMFDPTLKLSDYIKETSLEELIIIFDDESWHKFLTGQIDHHPKYRYHTPYDIEENMSVELKLMPATSNLAKVYFLQDFRSFYRHNREYYDNIIDSVGNKRREERKKEIQDNWNRYK